MTGQYLSATLLEFIGQYYIDLTFYIYPYVVTIKEPFNSLHCP